MVANGGPSDPLEIARRLSESFREVKFGRGIVGKTAYLTGGLLALWGVVLFRLGDNWWLNLALVSVAIAATLVHLWYVSSTQRFAKENPELALLEGAELLEYQRFEAEAKGMLPRPGRQPVVLTQPKELPEDE